MAFFSHQHTQHAFGFLHCEQHYKNILAVISYAAQRRMGAADSPKSRAASYAATPLFPTLSAEPERRESLRLAFSISLHLVLALNVGKVFALPSLISLHLV